MSEAVPIFRPEILVTAEYLNQHPNFRFVFGDNLVRKGTGGAAKLRGHAQSVGFITKKYPNQLDKSFFTVEEYLPVFRRELQLLIDLIRTSPGLIFLICPLGSNLANRFGIWEAIIRRGLLEGLAPYYNQCWFLFGRTTINEVGGTWTPNAFLL